MFEKTIEILSKFTTIAVADITPDMTLQGDLGLNSLDVVNIIVEFEDEFDIEIPDRLIKSFVKVGDVVEYLKSFAN